MRLKKRLKKEKNNKIIIISLIFLLVLLFINLYIISSEPFEIRVIDIKFSVGESFGIDLNNSLLTYGRIMPGSTVSRNITITNVYDFPLSVRKLISKNVAEVLSIKNNYDIIQPKSSLSFPVYLNIPINYTHGDYSGKLLMDFRKK